MGTGPPRDYFDVAALIDHYSRDQLLTIAAAKDSGFTMTTFIDALRAITRLQQPDWAEDGTSEVDAELLRALFDEWRTQLQDALAN